MDLNEWEAMHEEVLNKEPITETGAEAGESFDTTGLCVDSVREFDNGMVRDAARAANPIEGMGEMQISEGQD